MAVNVEKCKHFNWHLIQSGCCGRNKIVRLGTCGTPGDPGKMCNTDMPYCAYEEKSDIVDKNIPTT